MSLQIFNNFSNGILENCNIFIHLFYLFLGFSHKFSDLFLITYFLLLLNICIFFSILQQNVSNLVFTEIFLNLLLFLTLTVCFTLFGLDNFVYRLHHFWRVFIYHFWAHYRAFLIFNLLCEIWWGVLLRLHFHIVILCQILFHNKLIWILLFSEFFHNVTLYRVIMGEL